MYLGVVCHARHCGSISQSNKQHLIWGAWRHCILSFHADARNNRGRKLSFVLKQKPSQAFREAVYHKVCTCTLIYKQANVPVFPASCPLTGLLPCCGNARAANFASRSKRNHKRVKELLSNPAQFPSYAKAVELFNSLIAKKFGI